MADRAKQDAVAVEGAHDLDDATAAWRDGVRDTPRDDLDLEQLPIVTSKKCDRCGADIKPQEIIDKTHADWVILDIFCKGCEELRRCRIPRQV
jgi:hypothetical protein